LVSNEDLRIENPIPLTAQNFPISISIKIIIDDKLVSIRFPVLFTHHPIFYEIDLSIMVAILHKHYRIEKNLLVKKEPLTHQVMERLVIIGQDNRLTGKTQEGKKQEQKTNSSIGTLFLHRDTSGRMKGLRDFLFYFYQKGFQLLIIWTEYEHSSQP
jgi:hypothetical protein